MGLLTLDRTSRAHGGRPYSQVGRFFAHLLLTLFFAHAVLADLGNFYPVGADEVWIMSASFKLASTGVLGSDLFVGLHNADRHYFLALPVHHLLQAAVFVFAGAGIPQARAVSVVAAIALVWIVGWLAYKWHGLAGSVATTTLLMFWRSNLTGSDPRPPLLALAQSGRYDMTVVALWWLTVLLLAWHLDRPRRRTALALGLTAGATALTQFYGVGVVVCAAAALIWARRRNPTAARHWRDAAIGCGLPILLYCAYVGLHWSDFAGQAALQAERVGFLDPAFYVRNVANEWRRLAWLTELVPGAPGAGHVGWWLTLAALPLAVGTGIGAWRRGLPLVGFSALAAVVSLAALDSSKAQIYGALLVPMLSLALAAALVPARPRRRDHPLSWIRAILAAGLLVWVVADGLAGYRFVANEGRQASRYLDVGRRLAASLEPGATVLGSERWWWALRERPYRSLNGVWRRWGVAERAGHRPEFARELASLGRVYLILDKDTRGDLGRAPIELQRQVDRVLAEQGVRVAAWEDRTYGVVEIYRIAAAGD